MLHTTEKGNDVTNPVSSPGSARFGGGFEGSWFVDERFGSACRSAVCARLICRFFCWLVEESWCCLGFDGASFHLSGGDEEPFFAAWQSLAGELDVAHRSFVGSFGKTSFKNILLDLLLGDGSAHHVGLDVLKNLAVYFLLRVSWLPGGGSAGRANMFVGFNPAQVQHVFVKSGMGLVAYRACLMFGDGDDAFLGIDRGW